MWKFLEKIGKKMTEHWREVKEELKGLWKRKKQEFKGEIKKLEKRMDDWKKVGISRRILEGGKGEKRERVGRRDWRNNLRILNGGGKERNRKGIL